MSTVWQIASGDSGRDYSWLFLRHDLMFLGPGRYGQYEPGCYQNVVATGEFTGHKVASIGSFCLDVRPGDFVLLRKGHRVVALGLVPDESGGEGYRHDETFDDVYGWDLQHTRRVVWQDHLTADLEAIQYQKDLFSSRKQIPMFTRVGDPPVLNPITPLFARCVPRPLLPRPDPPPGPLTLEQLGQSLFAHGLANDAVDRVQRAIERQRRLLKWYYAQGEASGRPDEHEVVAHMVLPLMLGLGWSEQLLAVEWHKVDLAAFWGTPTTAEKCVLACEAKRMGHGLQDVRRQAIRYVTDLGLTRCRRILLTQGARFYLYQRAADGWPEEPSGYLNVERIRTDHIAPAGTNAVDTLMALTPAGALRP